MIDKKFIFQIAKLKGEIRKIIRDEKLHWSEVLFIFDKINKDTLTKK